MVGKTAAERKAAERARRVKDGLLRYEFWLTKSQALKVTALVRKLRRLSDNQAGRQS